jgi:hypothetical protein
MARRGLSASPDLAEHPGRAEPSRPQNQPGQQVEVRVFGELDNVLDPVEVFPPLDVWWAERDEEPSGDDERQCAAVVWIGKYLIEWLEAERYALDVSVRVLFSELERASLGQRVAVPAMSRVSVSFGQSRSLTSTATYPVTWEHIARQKAVCLSSRSSRTAAMSGISSRIAWPRAFRKRFLKARRDLVNRHVSSSSTLHA